MGTVRIYGQTTEAKDFFDLDFAFRVSCHNENFIPSLLIMAPISNNILLMCLTLVACLQRSWSFLPTTISKSEHSWLLFAASKDATFQYSASSLKHLENTELPDDYSRPWTETKIKALATGLAMGGILGTLGEFMVGNLFDVEKTAVIWAALGTGAGWYLGGGQQVAEDEKPINGGYDRKLIADRPNRLRSVLDSLTDTNKHQVRQMPFNRDLSKARIFTGKVHSEEYIALLESKSKAADRPERLNPVYSRTLIDQVSRCVGKEVNITFMA